MQPSRTTMRLATLRIVIIYAFFGAIWILASDTVLGWMVADPATLTKLAMFKGWLYVLLTSLLLYKLIHRDQQKLDELNHSLEQRVADAVAELRQKDALLLQQSRHAAMGEMLNNIAHQWRQPLNNIAIYVQGMQMLRAAGKLSDDELDKDVQSVMDIIQYMSKTIDDFRTFFQHEKQKQPFAVKEAAEKALRFVSARMEHHAITTQLVVRHEPTVEGYQAEYIQVLLNIINNAADALITNNRPDRQIIITLDRQEEQSSLSIRDNGGGIPQEALPHIFEPYFTTKGPTGGTGIGLYMAKEIIEKHMAGRLTASNVADGAEFIITV